MATGTSLSSIGLSWCILHDIVFQARELRLRTAIYVYCGMLALQVVLALVPIIVFRGPQNFFGPAGWVTYCSFCCKLR